MIRRSALVVVALTLALIGTPAQAGCTCQCVDGQMQPSCSATYDIPPICPATACPRTNRTTIPIAPPPLAGTTRRACQMVKDCNIYGSCSWKAVCS